MANVLKREKQIAVLRLLSEGNSIRSTMRLTGVDQDTIMRLIRRFGDACRSFLDEAMANLSLRHVQCDEIWTFVWKKREGHLQGNEKRDPTVGDIYLHTALDTDTKLLVSFTIGNASPEATHAFIADLEKRLVRQPLTQGEDRPQISTDGWNAYVPAIRKAFRGTVKHGVLIKNYVNPESGRYAPPDLVKADRFNVNGMHDMHVTRRAEQRNNPPVVQTVHAAHLCVLQRSWRTWRRRSRFTSRSTTSATSIVRFDARQQWRPEWSANCGE